MNRKSTIQDELKHLSPALAEQYQHKEDGFSQDFFDAMEKDILNKTIHQKPVQVRTIRSSIWLRAAALLLGISFVWLLATYNGSTSNAEWQAHLEEVSDDEILAYLGENSADLQLTDFRLEEGNSLEFLDFQEADAQTILQEDEFMISINYFD